VSDRPTTPTTDILTADDHARGCAGREYACTCGYDDRLAAEIRRLRAEVEQLRTELTTALWSDK
jgi:hypothetical protein